MYSAGGQQGGGEDDSAENSEMDTEEGVAEVSHGLLNRWTDIFILPRPI